MATISWVMARSAKSGWMVLPRETLDLTEVYDAHADFVWRSLYRLGVEQRDLPDLTQEVFLVLHRRRADYDPSRSLKAWLWGICVGQIRNYRRRLARRGETLTSAPPERREATDPESDLSRSRQRERGRRLLAQLDPEKRAVFVMFEVEGMSGKAIAELLEIPLGTVHTRLRAARVALRKAMEESS